MKRWLKTLWMGLVRLPGRVATWCVTPLGLLIVAGIMIALLALPLLFSEGEGFFRVRTRHSIASSTEIRPTQELKVYRVYDGDFLERSLSDEWSSARHIYQWEAMIDFFIDFSEVQVQQEGETWVVTLPPLKHRIFDRAADIPAPHCDTIEGSAVLGNRLRKTVKQAVAKEIEWRLWAYQWEARAKTSAERLIRLLCLPSEIPEENLRFLWPEDMIE